MGKTVYIEVLRKGLNANRGKEIFILGRRGEEFAKTKTNRKGGKP